MLALLQGFHPASGDALLQNAGPDRRYGYDLTFSAPKSVSVTWAIADRKSKYLPAKPGDIYCALSWRQSGVRVGPAGHVRYGIQSPKFCAISTRHHPLPFSFILWGGSSRNVR
ncbi:relaxase domain-containing protein [Acidithiobacillus ferrooxidans]|uniref:relaxase domain-containing protein n=1 Tax=Acidithiobacillus ferrooxidans TaxID=920 RepID=UPI001C06E6E9|nr:relaxase domain-containing protein [Acidithiobacillus ferrooxidans]MBU2860289.1 relaxase domain-containing protein [Acidithiobacillus ferrooxidans]